MGTAENKQRMQDIFAELAAGNSKPFVDSFADDIQWTQAAGSHGVHGHAACGGRAGQSAAKGRIAAAGV